MLFSLNWQISRSMKLEKLLGLRMSEISLNILRAKYFNG